MISVTRKCIPRRISRVHPSAVALSRQVSRGCRSRSCSTSKICRPTRCWRRCSSCARFSAATTPRSPRRSADRRRPCGRSRTGLGTFRPGAAGSPPSTRTGTPGSPRNSWLLQQDVQVVMSMLAPGANRGLHRRTGALLRPCESASAQQSTHCRQRRVSRAGRGRRCRWCPGDRMRR